MFPRCSRGAAWLDQGCHRAAGRPLRPCADGLLTDRKPSIRMQNLQLDRLGAGIRRLARAWRSRAEFYGGVQLVRAFALACHAA